MRGRLGSPCSSVQRQILGSDCSFEDSQSHMLQGCDRNLGGEMDFKGVDP